MLFSFKLSQLSVFRWGILTSVLLLGFCSSGCNANKPAISEELTVGVVSYGEGTVSAEKYERFQNYLGERTQALVQLEPAYNELQAVEQVHSNHWEIVFAPPGLAAIAISEENYMPLFALEGISSTQRSLIVVRQDSPIQTLADLSNQTIALGQPGSAAGYYLPLYDLYGLTLAEIRFAPTPKTLLEWISRGEVAAGALAERDYDTYRRASDTPLRVLHTSRWIPPGVVLVSPTIEPALQRQIQQAMSEAPSDIAADAGYVPAAKLPSYTQFIGLVSKVRPIETQIRRKPAVLTIDPSPLQSSP